MCALIPPLLLIAPAFAQLTIVNPTHLDIPPERARVLLSGACLVVAHEFHERDNSELRFQTVLVLGNDEEHYTVDEKKRVYTLFLKQWDEQKFATLAMRFCVQRLASPSRENRLVKEILRRADRIGPMSVNSLRGPGGSQPVSGPLVSDDCDSALREKECRQGQPPH